MNNTSGDTSEFSTAISAAFEMFRMRLPLDSEIVKLSQVGWFLNYCMTPVETQRLVNDYMNASIRKVDSDFIDWLNNNGSNQKRRLIKLFPNAKKLITEAFLMHKKGYYNSSVCLFLIIADHISKDSLSNLTKIEPYRGVYSLNSRAMEKLKNLTENRSTNGMNLYLPLVRSNSINQSDTDSSNYKHSINRHAILHGKNVVFGNKLNSFKALSFLIFVLDAMRVLSYQSKEI